LVGDLGRKTPRKDANEAAQALVQAINSLVTAGSGDGKDVRVIMYFDEAHSLSERDNGILYKTLCTALADITFPQVFSIMLSTNSSLLESHPAQIVHPSAWVNADEDPMQAPWTEIVFDCMKPGEHIIRPNQYSLAEIAEVDFMIKFGRPL
jgi:hypothetical protein